MTDLRRALLQEVIEEVKRHYHEYTDYYQGMEKLIEWLEAQAALAGEDESLEQPSPLRVVPSTASDGTGYVMPEPTNATPPPAGVMDEADYAAASKAKAQPPAREGVGDSSELLKRLEITNRAIEAILEQNIPVGLRLTLDALLKHNKIAIDTPPRGRVVGK